MTSPHHPRLLTDQNLLPLTIQTEDGPHDMMFNDMDLIDLLKRMRNAPQGGTADIGYAGADGEDLHAWITSQDVRWSLKVPTAAPAHAGYTRDELLRLLGEMTIELSGPANDGR